ncbi:hypothetical protein DB346_13710 [Verrucomicrobia bacterium LW23]|nr:hypothetical protein DB346_13710 [Verrucomicrobia bacterium LW23]
MSKQTTSIPHAVEDSARAQARAKWPRGHHLAVVAAALVVLYPLSIGPAALAYTLIFGRYPVIAIRPASSFALRYAIMPDNEVRSRVMTWVY